jgi:hypothetical protein
VLLDLRHQAREVRHGDEEEAGSGDADPPEEELGDSLTDPVSRKATARLDGNSRCRDRRKLLP